MFVSTPRLKTQGAVVSALSLLALAACEDPTASTDLRPEGNPEVLTVLVFNDSVDGVVESATFCKKNDIKRPNYVGIVAYGLNPLICAEDLGKGAGTLDDMGTSDKTDDVFMEHVVEDAVPTGWYIRIMFDELLDADTAETLEPVLDPDTMEETGVFVGSLAETQPVTLTCGGVDVPYDGYYSPSGNTVTWPLGPSLGIQPRDVSAVATGEECMVTLKDTAKDKDGNAVPSDQRGPFNFTIAGLAATALDPEPADPGDEATIAPEAPLLVSFNHFIDAASLTTTGAGAEIEILEVADCAATTGTARTAVVAVSADDPLSLEISSTPTVPAGLAWTPEKFYRVTFLDNIEVADLAGGTGTDLAGVSVCFATDAAS